MARKTGYSASTLSQAASGTRKPTLDVLLAYVGALGGDQDAWRERWQALDADAAPAAEAPVPGGDPGRPTSRVTGRIALAGSLALVVIAAGATALTRRGGSDPATSPTVAAPGCPAVPETATFTARTYGSGAKVRQGPARLEPEIHTVPPGCTIGLTGFCLGERIIDATAGTPDVRWFMVAGGGVVSSAVVHGNPPAGMTVSRCPGDRAAPSAITLEVTADPDDPGQVVLNATGSGVDIVGYAAYYARDAHGAASWHQIGLTGSGDEGFAMRWRIDRLPAGAKPIVAAAACLGGEAPTPVVDLGTVPAGGATGPAAGHRSAAAATACLYPVAK
ncbi:helix-turn-helix domain-containing protein [Actinoplanes flavus]|uniref:Helix-turn-helix transcriptional regulator n=1 Tax=Actinoplanes flavus TaxID=2820290 RepID=A0ABS3UUD4_9ACTN|nr:helix-turn-helix transcriptional regulator [Actinoplanes flavus]MBO3742152.1 helix-turn-helix transcriptional regulator [Actinoplanes flavus]